MGSKPQIRDSLIACRIRQGESERAARLPLAVVFAPVSDPCCGPSADGFVDEVHAGGPLSEWTLQGENARVELVPCEVSVLMPCRKMVRGFGCGWTGSADDNDMGAWPFRFAMEAAA